jgi:hypothetical protein
MKRILWHFPGLGANKLFDHQVRDGVNEPYIFLRDKLLEYGYELLTADNYPVKGCEWIWLWDYKGGYEPIPTIRDVIRWGKYLFRHKKFLVEWRPLYSECKQAGMLDRLVLFLGEPPSVLPQNWSPRLHRRFKIIFTWNDTYAAQPRFHKFRMPLPQNFPAIPSIPFQQRKLITNISSNKRSSHPRQLYTARQQIIRYFEKELPQEFDLYGVGWERPLPGDHPYPSFRGRVANKWDVIPKYRFCICYENLRDEPGYISEKIFDCMRAGCVPIYRGADNIQNEVFPEAFIDRRKFVSEAELAEYLVGMSAKEYAQFLQAIDEYLHSSQFAAYLPPAFFATIQKALNL